jgi:hypothetical protein
VYKIADSGSVFGKVMPYFAFAGRYLLKDISGPGSVIGDGDAWRFCVAYRAGECRSGSAVNDVFLNVPKARLDGDGCVVNTYAQNYPCFRTLAPHAGWFIQGDTSVTDPHFRRYRRLTMGFTGPGRQYQFQNAHTTPDGKWAFLSPGWIDGVRPDSMMMKLPPWPLEDGISRNRFFKLRETVGPYPEAPSARIRFGYAENGPAESFFCTSRQESCVTDSAQEPFAYALTDNLTPVACAAGCSMEVPVIPGRVVYYRIERLDGDGNVLFTGPTKAYGVR